MFISSEEKKYLFDQIKQLTTVTEKLDKLQSRVIFWEAKVRSLETKVDTLNQIALHKSAKPKKPKKPLTDAQRIKQAQYMKAYHAKKRAEKALEKA